MSKIDAITEKYRELRYMKHEQALYMRDIIHKNKLKSLAELGHFHGKSSIYMAAILEEQGGGTLTTFDLSVKPNIQKPSIYDLMKEFELEQYIKVVTSQEGYIWDLADIIKKSDQRFDFCYIDGSHTFLSTALGFVLVDILMDSGGVIIFDDINWTIDDMIQISGPEILRFPMYGYSSALQRKTKQVRMVCDVVMPHYNYELLDMNDTLNWAVYQKR